MNTEARIALEHNHLHQSKAHPFSPSFEHQCKGSMAQEVTLAVLKVAHTHHLDQQF